MQPEIAPDTHTHPHTFPFHLINFSFGALIVRVSFIFELLPFSSHKLFSFLESIRLDIDNDDDVVFAKWSDAINYSKIFHATYKMNVSSLFFRSRLFVPDNKADLIECISLCCIRLLSVRLFSIVWKSPPYVCMHIAHSIHSIPYCASHDSFAMPSIKITYYWMLFLSSVRLFVRSSGHKWKM